MAQKRATVSMILPAAQLQEMLHLLGLFRETLGGFVIRGI
jgi:hypothetical protein